MKFLKKSIYALSLVSMMGLWSCSQDEMMQGGEPTTVKGHTVPVTLTVSRGDAQTRTVLEENTDGTLNDIWKDGDKLAVYSEDGMIYHGDITIIDGQETSVGVFSGTLDNISDGEADYFLWYSNPNNDRITVDKDSYNVYRYNVNYYDQAYATITDLSAMDLLNKKIRLSVNGNKATVVNDYKMEAKLPLVHFTLVGDLAGATGTLKIYDDNRTVKCPVTGGYMRVTAINGQNPHPGAHDDAYTYLAAKVTDGEVYLAMQPTYSTSSEVKLRFEFEKDGKKYTYGFENTTALNPGYYYSTVLDLVTEEEPEVVDHSKNPLAKWAEANLVQDSSTDGATSKSYIPSSSSTKGSLYQWGRNKGWKDYVAARDYVTQLGNATYALTNFDGEVDADGMLKTNYSTGLGHFYLNNKGYVVCPSMYGLTAVEDIVVNPEYWIMNGQTSNSTGDYWIGNEGGSTWSERATAGGFEYESPAPENWRLPTKEEFLQITPKDKTITDSQYTLKEELNNYTELREIPGTLKYVIRWKADNSGINISAIVVSDSFTKKDINNVNWSDSNVVKRFFPYTGVIRSSVISCTPKNAPYYNLNGKDVLLDGWFSIYANMYPMGDVTSEEYCSNYDKLGNYLYGYYFSAKINVLTNHNDKVGAYWVSDSKEAFYFNTNENWSGQTTRFGVQGRTSNLHSVRPDNGYAIRCVKDN